MTVELFGKDGCHLCEVARAAVEAIRREVPFELRVVDITSDRELYERYRYDIPVVLVEGEEAFRHRVDPAALRELLVRRGLSPIG